VRGRRRVLDEKFEGNENRFQGFVRNDNECRRAILQSAGLDAGDGEIMDFRARYYGEPDIVCRLADGRCAVIELAFILSARHAFKDLAYAADPAASNVAGLIWLCDSVSASVPEMVHYYATKLALDRRITLEILVPQAQRFDGAPPLRFSFDPLLRDLRAGAPRKSHDGVTVLERLAKQYRTSDEIDTVALARILGVTPTWVTLHASKPKKREHAPRLVSLRAPNGSRLRGADGRFLFELERVTSFVTDFEQFVAQVEVPGATLPLVSARDPRIGVDWLTLEQFRNETPTRQYAAIKRSLGAPLAFCISTSGLGYSLLWPRERSSALRRQAA
jgi:hypothetical protein